MLYRSFQTMAISTEQRAIILTLHNEGYTFREIGQRLSMHHSTVSNIVRSHQNTYHSTQRTSHGCRRRCSKRDERRIVHMIQSGECETATQIYRNLRSCNLPEVSVGTVRRILRRHGYAAYIKRKKTNADRKTPPTTTGMGQGS